MHFNKVLQCLSIKMFHFKIKQYRFERLHIKKEEKNRRNINFNILFSSSEDEIIFWDLDVISMTNFWNKMQIKLLKNWKCCFDFFFFFLQKLPTEMCIFNKSICDTHDTQSFKSQLVFHIHIFIPWYSWQAVPWYGIIWHDFLTVPC